MIHALAKDTMIALGRDKPVVARTDKERNPTSFPSSSFPPPHAIPLFAASSSRGNRLKFADRDKVARSIHRAAKHFPAARNPPEPERRPLSRSDTPYPFDFD